MPLVRKTERVVVVRADHDGNILNYDVVEQPVRSNMVEKPTSVSRSSSVGQSPRMKRTERFEEENDYEDEENKDNRTVSNTHRDTTERKKPKPRRVRYIRQKSNVKIFEEKVEWNANRKVDTNNEELMRRITNAPMHKVFREKLDWHAESKIDTHNEAAIDTSRRSSAKRRIFVKKPASNDGSQIDTSDEYTTERLKSSPKPTIFHEKFAWQSNPRIDHHNPDYEEHKKREKLLQQEKSFVQNFPQEWKPKDDRLRIDHYNPEFVEHKKQQKSAKLPPIEDRKLEWQKTPRVNQRNDDYIERMRQKRSEPMIFREKLQWVTKTPRINMNNEEYLENLKEQTRPKILSKLPRWKSQAKLDTYNEPYDSLVFEKPIILNEKLRWHARPKIDTGLEPESEDEEYNDNHSTA